MFYFFQESIQFLYKNITTLRFSTSVIQKQKLLILINFHIIIYIVHYTYTRLQNRS